MYNFVNVYKNDRIVPSILFMRATATATEITKFRLLVGDVLPKKDWDDWTDIAVPVLVEYDADSVDDADQRIQRYIGAEQRRIALVREYHTRLISDVVTGKLGVRETSADLSETDLLLGRRPGCYNPLTTRDIAKEATPARTGTSVRSSSRHRKQ